MNLIIQPYRYALSIAMVAAGFLLMETAPLFWPPIYQNARAAILVMFCGFALLTLVGDTQGRIRSASGLAVGAALLAASALALTDPTIAAGVLVDSFKAWRNAGYSGIESIRAWFRDGIASQRRRNLVYKPASPSACLCRCSSFCERSR
ncbi:hypothetical protein [Neorhizobium lilium]|uniref:hypothetical protein n=1 Tax=Neorhizobium lilium TaxID=2503024 RepID=UPI001FE002D1|nr:hypothetical protein [Neorhizobium lilium]